MKMLEKRLWPNFAYIFLLLLICITLWQITIDPIKFTDLVQQQSSTFYTLYGLNSSNYYYRHPIHTLPTNDYNQLIDLNFTFNILNLVCNNDTVPLLLLIAIHSAANNAKKRKVIRETWGGGGGGGGSGGKSSTTTDMMVRIVFMVGNVNDSNLQKDLENESELYNDLVQGQFLDTYRNITYKHVMLFKYSIYHCSNARYILKTDDDVFVHVQALFNFLTLDLSPYGASKLLYCTPRRNVMPSRTYRSKWRVSFKEYNRKRYPTYCPGWVLLYSPDVIFHLYKVAQQSEYFWIDDVHVTGTIAERIGLQHSDIENLVLTNQNQYDIIVKSANITIPFLFGRPNLNSNEIKTLYEFTKNHHTPRSLISVLN